MIRTTTLRDIICDGCAYVYYGNCGSLATCPYAPTVRRNAREEGWKQLKTPAGPQDFCPECLEDGTARNQGAFGERERREPPRTLE